MRTNEICLFLFLAVIGLIFPAITGIACTVRHCLFNRKEPEEDDYDKRHRELLERRRKHNKAVKDNPEEADALEIILRTLAKKSLSGKNQRSQSQ